MTPDEMQQAMQAYWQRDPTNATRNYWRPVVDAATAEPTEAAVYQRPSLTGPLPPRPGVAVAPVQPAGQPGVDLRPAQAYSYEYKNPAAPGAAPGRQVGPMAQDLEKTPAAAHTVQQGPDGMKRVDTGRLALVNTAAIGQEQKRVDRLEALLAAHEKALAAYQPSGKVAIKDPNLAALDDAYSRAAADPYALHTTPYAPAQVVSDANAKQKAFELGMKAAQQPPIAQQPISDYMAGQQAAIQNRSLDPKNYEKFTQALNDADKNTSGDAKSYGTGAFNPAKVAAGSTFQTADGTVYKITGQNDTPYAPASNFYNY